MDHSSSSPSYHLHLAQMPTGQRESEYPRLPVQTIQMMPQSNTLQPSYNSYPTITSWSVSRSMDSHQDLGYSNIWDATISGPGEQQFSLPERMRVVQPETMRYPYQSSSHLPMASPTMMDQLSHRVVKSDPDMPFQQGHQSSKLWTNHEQNLNYHSMELEDAMKLEDSDGTTLSIPTAPPSPISITSHHSSSHSSDSVHSNPISIMTDNSSPRPSSGDSEEDHPADPPYSQLIYQALREAKGHRLQLQDIYAWFEKNTNKGKDQGKGWQNSIRHNLSMNAGFEAIKTDVPGGKRALNYWSLTAQAISKGRVESTTRYRRPTPKKGLVSQRGNAKVQKSWDETRQPKNQKHRPTTKSPSQQLVYARVGQGEPVPPYQIPPVSTASHMQICPYAFDYDRVVACTPSSHGNGNSPMFYDNVDPAPSWELVGMDNYEWLSGLNNGAGSGSEGQLRMHGHVKEKRWG